jgi:IclR family pca regulon transcriptional regulator
MGKKNNDAIDNNISSTIYQNEDKKSRLFIASIEKGMRVLKTFDTPSRQLSLSEISSLTGMSISSAQRCTHTLTALGYLSKDQQTRKYELSVRLLNFASYYLRSNKLANKAFPHLQQLSKETGETVNLTVLDDTDIVIVLRFLSPHVLVSSITIGTRVPAYCNSSGLAMLAHLPETQVIDIIKRSSLVKHTQYTVIDPKAILRRLENIRQKGYALCQEEYFLGDIATSAPILNCSGHSIGGITVALSKARWGGMKDEKRFAHNLIDIASAISEKVKSSENRHNRHNTHNFGTV